MKTVLTIAGSDCSGGAGIQADIKTISSLGAYAMSVITSVVAENTTGVIASWDMPVESIMAQLEAIFTDIEVDAVKIGMLPSAQCMKAVASELKKHAPGNIVVDPVMCAKDGTFLMGAIDAFTKEILPLATLLTPNIPEAERLTGMTIKSISDMEGAAKAIATSGAKAVLIKGGHFDGDPCDVLFDGEITVFQHERIATKNTHGTGCTLSSAIATFLSEASCREAVGKAIRYISGAIEHSLELGKGHGPLNHFYNFFDTKNQDFDCSLYLCTDKRMIKMPLEKCVEQAIDGGVTVVQLRDKDCSSREFYNMGRRIREITAKKHVPLIVNDRVDIALAIGADGVHLGQSDLPCAAVRDKVGRNMIIGVTAHNLIEAKQAEFDGADYIGVGAMFKTGTKSDAKVISRDELAKIRQEIKIPIVLIGGINKDNVSQLKGMGDGIAVVSAILGSDDIRRAAKELKELWE